MHIRTGPRIAGLLAMVLFCCPQLTCICTAQEVQRPNVLWISCEDTSPWLGFCGEAYATTPHLDALVGAGVRYTNAFAPNPVCSPARFAIITGLYATSMGAQGLRSELPIPASAKGFPTYLRQAGYYCTNNVKTDYNTREEPRLITESWDQSNANAHWRGRKPGQPFFAVFNLMQSHQSNVFGQEPIAGVAESQRHNPAYAPVPPYYPQTPEAQRTIARVHDCLTAMDKAAGNILRELEQDGLRENTIIFFWSDHGQGIPRGKRTLWDSGSKVALAIWFPERYRNLAPAAPGGVCEQLVSLIDLGPTVLSLLDVPIPPNLDGRPFLGKSAVPPRQELFGARDRVDEAFELSRSVRDSKYLYIRNYMPDLSWNQPEGFSDQLPLRREIATLAAGGKLDAAQMSYAGPGKPLEALYDCEQDPWQLKNLADDPALREVLNRMRGKLRAWQIARRDLGFMHESHAVKLCANGAAPSELATSERNYPLERILDTADRVGRPGQVAQFTQRLSDADATIRYWAAIGLRAAGPEARSAKEALLKALDDESAPVSIEAAGILVREFDDRRALESLAQRLRGTHYVETTHTARTLQLLSEKARPAIAAMRRALADKPHLYVEFALSEALRRLDAAR